MSETSLRKCTSEHLIFLDMILIEVENKNTGAKLRIPQQYTFIEETFEKSVEEYTWEQWTAPASTTASSIREEFNGKNHCLYGTWETFCQSSWWDRAITAVKQGGSKDETMIRLLKKQ